MRVTRILRFTAAALLLALAVLTTPATVPGVMNYQGRLTDNSPQQNPVNATLPMEFHIYDSLTGNNLLWSESWQAVTVTDGIFVVLLGSNGGGLPATIFDGTERYLEIIVDGETLTPRQRLGSVAHAFTSEELAKKCADGQYLRRADGEWLCADLAVCNADSFISCYSGPGGTAGVGECRNGSATCNPDGSGYGACTGEVLPQPEVCDNGRDENCDGIADGGCPCPGDLDNCQGSCVDTDTDPQNCGGCGNTCSPGQVCLTGQCFTSSFGGLVTNPADPSQPGSGVSSLWSYQGLVGVEAGHGMCAAAGADFVCTYADVLSAEASGELDNLKQQEGATFWVHRLSIPVDVGGGTSQPGAGGRCNDWTYPTNHISDGEYGRVSEGRFEYFFDQDTTYTGNAADGHAGNGPDDGGPCGGAPPRGLLCCNCPNANDDFCGGACTDTQSDNQNCGGCGNACSGNQSCENGSCISPPVSFAGTVTNETDPTQPGPGLSSVWFYAGEVGVAAGDLMCSVAGADHICTYAELEAADQQGQLDALRQQEGLSFWVHRVSTVVDVGGNQSPPGAGGRCNDWTYPTNHIADGEYGRVGQGQLQYFFDQDTTFSGDPADGHAGAGPDDGGPCGGAPPRALLCCN